MTKQLDQAQELDALHREQALKCHRQKTRQIEAGTGICHECGEPIPVARLAVQPGALRCIDCQTIAELKETHYVGCSC